MGERKVLLWAALACTLLVGCEETKPRLERIEVASAHRACEEGEACGVVETSCTSQGCRCGVAVNPDNIAAQMEGGIVFGLTAALFGEITIEGGAVVQSNFPDYPMLRMAQVPRIEVHLVPSGAPIGGAGEVGTPPAAPALANAIFAATGRRVRELPLVKQGFQVAALRSGRTFA